MGFFDGLVNNIRDLARPYSDDDDFELDFAPEDTVPPTPVTVQEPAKPKVRTFGRGFRRSEAAAQPEQPVAPVSAPAGNRAARSQPVITNPSARSDVKLTAPKKFIYVRETAEYLRSGYVVIVNLQETDEDDVCRIIDFLSGFAYALGGNIECAAPRLYTITPSNVGISRDSNEELKSGSVTL